MSAMMSERGPITSATRSWADQRASIAEHRPRGWNGFKIGPESGLTAAEEAQLRAANMVADR